MSIAMIALVLGGPIAGLYTADRIVPAVLKWRRRARRARRRALR